VLLEDRDRMVTKSTGRPIRQSPHRSNGLPVPDRLTFRYTHGALDGVQFAVTFAQEEQVSDVSRASDVNAPLVGRMLLDFDKDPVAAASQWLAADFTTIINGEPPMNVDAYRQMVAMFAAAFSDVQHEIHDLVAEGDQVAVSTTLHLTHTGEYEGIAATGRRLRVAEMAVVTIRDGKLASERAVIDFASMMRQLTAP
jgi:steroid delta-isomerase-like uncharacterized protein